MLEKLRNSLEFLTIYDYLALSTLALVIILLVVLTILFKNIFFRSIFILAFLFAIIVGPFAVNFSLNEIVRKNDLNVTEQKELNFSNTLIVSGTIKNSGIIDFNKCLISTYVILKTDNSYIREFKRMFHPSYKQIEELNLSNSLFLRGDIKDFRVVIDNFNFVGEYEVIVKGDCY